MLSSSICFESSSKKQMSFLFFLFMLFIGAIFINHSFLFIDIGISIRPFHFLLIPFFIILIKKDFYKYFYYIVSYFFVFFFGLISSCINMILLNQNAENLLFAGLSSCIQVFVFSVSLYIFSSIEEKRLFHLLCLILPFIVSIPLILYFMSKPYWGVPNLQGNLGFYTGHNGVPRMCGTCNDPNYFGLYLYIYLGLLYYLKVSIQYKSSFLYRLFFTLGIIDLFLTFSRTAIIVLTLSIFLLFFRKHKIKCLCILLLLFIAFFICLNFLGTELSEKLITHYASTKEEGSFLERIDLIKYGILSCIYVPLGMGIGSCKEYYLLFYGAPRLAHNDWLTILIECSFWGLLIYLFLWLKAFFMQNHTGKVLVLCVMFYMSTLTSYYYEPIIPIALSFFLTRKTHVNNNNILNT